MQPTQKEKYSHSIEYVRWILIAFAESKFACNGIVFVYFMRFLFTSSVACKCNLFLLCSYWCVSWCRRFCHTACNRAFCFFFLFPVLAVKYICLHFSIVISMCIVHNFPHSNTLRLHYIRCSANQIARSLILRDDMQLHIGMCVCVRLCYILFRTRYPCYKTHSARHNTPKKCIWNCLRLRVWHTNEDIVTRASQHKRMKEYRWKWKHHNGMDFPFFVSCIRRLCVLAINTRIGRKIIVTSSITLLLSTTEGVKMPSHDELRTIRFNHSHTVDEVVSPTGINTLARESSQSAESNSCVIHVASWQNHNFVCEFVCVVLCAASNVVWEHSCVAIKASLCTVCMPPRKPREPL